METTQPTPLCLVSPSTTPSGGDSGDAPSGSSNPCKLCTPLGACIAFKGVAGCVPLLHGSQGCSTYIRRYCISHYREPIDIASSNFSEDSAVFGGRQNLHLSIDNITRQYRPALVGIATTCLSETMGENVPMMLAEYRAEERSLPEEGEAPELVHVSTPSFKGTHVDGFHATVRSLVNTFAGKTEAHPAGVVAPVALFPGMVSPADLRHLRTVFGLWGVPVSILPDYSETLDGPSWADYERLPAGGTTLDEIRGMAWAPGAVEFGCVLAGESKTAGAILAERFAVRHHRLGLPIGLRETDRFFGVVEAISGREVPELFERERGRLVDSYVDGHKYLAGRRAVVYGESDLVAALAIFLAETGVTPVLCASGERNGRLEPAILAAAPELAGKIQVLEGSDFTDISEGIASLAPDLLIGSSKGHKLARELGIPLVRCGFPIHDRIGAQRIQHLCYAGSQQLYDRIANALLERKQDGSEVGYSYL